MNFVTKCRLCCQLALLVSLTGNQLLAQDKPAQKEINQQLSQLESELGKYKDSSPEAAALMLKLGDQYYQHGRALGLVRICQRFTSIQIKHGQHQQMMLKLIDGFQVLSRNKDMIVACRQYLERYGKSPQANSVEVRLADALMQTADREGAAIAAHAVWKRNGNNPVGKKYVQIAVYRYQALGGKYQKQGAELSEDVLNRMPKGTFAQFMGENAAKLFHTIGARVESNRVIAKLFQQGLAGDKNSQRQWHILTAQNHESLQQYTNASSSYQRARQIRDDQNLLYSQIMNVYNSQANPAQTESLLNQFKSKYPNDARKWTLQLYVANQYLGAMNKSKALALIRDALQGDAVTFDAAGIFLRENGSELPRLQDTERAFRAALGKQKNPASRARLYRYLAFSIYTGEAVNKNRSLALCREFLSRWAENSSDTHTMINYLFVNSPDDNTFRRDVKMVLAARKKSLQYSNLFGYPKAWLAANKSNKDLKTRVAILKQELAAADQDALLKLWVVSTGNTKKATEIRSQLLQPNYFNAINNEMATQLLYQQTYYYRHYAPAAKRGEGTKFYAQWAKKYPTDDQVARNYVVFATDYGIPEDCRAALQHMLRFQWKSSDPDLHRRMMMCAGRNKDANLARQAYGWIKREEQKHGYVASYTVEQGDVLQELKLANEAKERFTIASKAAIFTTTSRDAVMRLVTLEMDRAKKIQLLQQAIAKNSDYYGYLVQQLEAIYLVPEEEKKIDWNTVLTLLEQEQKRRVERPFRSSGLDPYAVVGYLSPLRADEEMPAAQKTQFLQRFTRLNLELASPVAQMFLSDAADPAASPMTQQLLIYQATTLNSGESYRGFDQLTQFVRAAAANQRHVVATTVGTGILANFSSVDVGRQKAVRDLVSRSYTQIGEVGLTIDEDSPIASLLQAALYLRLGDQELAFDLYTKNKALFDEHRELMPVDLVEFVVKRLIAAGGDENFNYVEDLVRTWIVKNTESEQVGIDAKATMQLLLARNYFKARRFDIARNEYTTAVNRYPDTSQAVEAQFGIGESFMEQKVFDQAEQVFDKLANSTETLIVVRAEFLRGVLSFRRGDRDEARAIFRSVLERVPDVELANQTLYNLSEVYRVEERYIDQLNLLRTIGRLGRRSKNRHAPGMPLSIVVHDSDLGISRGQNRIPVIVTTLPGKDREMVYLVSTGAGKGLFRADLETSLGEVAVEDGRLQLTGKDVIRCDYPDEFKKEFKSVPLSDVDIRVAANAEFEIASSTLDGDDEVSFSQALAAQEEDTGDSRLSQVRPSNQVKPGNPLYIRVEDTDRDFGADLDKLVVKMVTDSGDEVQVEITETAPHSGIFEGQVQTAELPAGALATDSAIDHSPLMAIDKDPKTFWSSQPDGAAPKTLTVDMKDLYSISRVSIATPSQEHNTPVR
ncbi:MAG: tetratricopeptide repeat protein, partial [Pirellulaceae bacterium]